MWLGTWRGGLNRYDGGEVSGFCVSWIAPLLNHAFRDARVSECERAKQGQEDGNGEIVDTVHLARPAFWSISLFLAVQSQILGNVKGYALFTFIQCVEIS